jgi:hypothetical protein
MTELQKLVWLALGSGMASALLALGAVYLLS